MDVKGTKTIPASRETVWRLLNDLAVLKASLKGCEELSWDGTGALHAVVQAKIGPVNARFRGKITLVDLMPPGRYAMI
ncbi:MAG TPA: SRPBCC domain-containing protein, partial [Sphingomonadales bacterium]|nr:SRPBCC domain-containing protein [Sphingomonadales bacterium]